MITLALAIANLILFVILIFRVNDVIQDISDMQDRYGNALQAQDAKIHFLKRGLNSENKPHTSEKDEKRTGH